ncbi:hypothetical protein C491_00832 [Natronococcus amylolyticus DSM 10524]|uniref:CARDB domain-containing protein n=1 Tax=Natronococcus amylolyticus DSM 10524 TaxID=1227497 RepID=L9XL27_9EURY|nr:hypothetical protein [Natronococcus amylolyticus]ELY61358.1 hypothetical protein C491_00832 [Natronococcus amylolyticus DSM 10524]
MWGDRQLRRYGRRRVLGGIAAGAVLAATSVAVGRTRPEGVGVRLRETNAPVAAGERLEVTADLEGRTETTVDARLVVGHDPETVEERSVALEPDETASITLGYETPRVRRTQSFPVRLEAGADADERTVTVLGTDDGESAAIRPDADEITVQPGTTVLFEVAAGRRLEPADLEWEADDAIAGDLALASDYTFLTGTGAYLAAPEATGSYDVGATVPTETGSASHDWILEVDSTGREPPTIESFDSDPDADATVGVDDVVENRLVARDPEGRLDRVVWIEGQNRTVLRVDDLEGERDESTLARMGPGWVAAGYPTGARVVCEDGRTSAEAVVDGPEIRPPFAVEIVGTNEPLEGGDRLEITVEVENEGGMMVVGDTTQEIELLVGTDRERVDTAAVTVPFGTTETVTLGYETYPVATEDTFPVRVESPDDAAERTVTVDASG